MSEINLKKIDLTTLFTVILLIIMGAVNIYSTTHADNLESPLLLNNPFGKQIVFILLSVLLFLSIQLIPYKYFQKFASIAYMLSILSLLGLFVFGKNINGSTAWYQIFGFGLQPSEFAKPITALALAKYLSDINANIRTIKTQFYSFLIIFFPVLLIMLQPDPGSVLIFLSFFFVFYKIGLPSIYMNFFISFILLFFLTVVFSKEIIILPIIIISILTILYLKKKKKSIRKVVLYTLILSSFVFSVDFIFNNIFEQHHRDRINIVMGIQEDNRGIGYNTNQSKIAFASGSFFGEGFLKGPQTRGNFVPFQHTDYIFSAIGEEWGFIGSSIVICLFAFLMLRISRQAELQRNLFSKIFSYSTATIIFSHFFINIGMVLGLVPTIGIPLPFFSYGGSSLLGFVLLISIYIRLDSERTSKW
tara:strand:+ start:13723 stop:14976 length:1254 start_codon:yes stop_codon:yes gene_type:complete